MSKQQITTKSGASPVGAYSQGLRAGDFIFVSGQGPLDPETGEYKKGDIQSETRQVFENIKSILEAAGTSMENVVKVNVYLRDINDFAAMNEVYKTYFQTPFPARTTIQAGALPRGFAVEIECIAKAK